jgi:tetratricopeptide (TPR) repeat protein
MNELKIILSDRNLIFEVKNISGTNHYRESFNHETLETVLKNYLKQIYTNQSIFLGKDFLKAVKSLEKLNTRVITIKSDCQWRRDNSPLEFSRIENQAKVTSRIDLNRDMSNYDRNSLERETTTPEVSFSIMEQLKSAVERNPNDAEAHNKLGVAYLSQKDYDLAIDTFREAISINPDKADYFYNLGCVYYEYGNLPLSIAELREAINIDHDHHQAFYKIGKALFEMGKPHDAIPYFHQAIVIKPFFIDAYIQVGLVYNQLEYYAEAIFIFEDVLSFEPLNTEAQELLNKAHQIKLRVEATELNNIGIAYAEKGKMDKAVEKFKKALTLNQNDAEIHYNLGLAYQKQNLLEDAIREFEQTIKIDPAIEEVHISLAEIYKEQNKYEKAIISYEKFIETTSEADRKQEVLNNIGNLKAQLKS